MAEIEQDGYEEMITRMEEDEARLIALDATAAAWWYSDIVPIADIPYAKLARRVITALREAL